MEDEAVIEVYENIREKLFNFAYMQKGVYYMRTKSRVFFLLFVVHASLFVIISVLAGPISVLSTDLPLGFSLIPGLSLVFIVSNIIFFLCATLVVSKDKLLKVIAVIVLFTSLYLAVILPATNGFCKGNFNICYATRVKFIEDLPTSKESMVEYNPGRYKINDLKISLSGDVRIGQKGNLQVIAFRVNYGFIKRYVIYVSDETNPDKIFFTTLSSNSSSCYQVIEKVEDHWYLVKDKSYISLANLPEDSILISWGTGG